MENKIEYYLETAKHGLTAIDKINFDELIKRCQIDVFSIRVEKFYNKREDKHGLIKLIISQKIY